MRIKHALLAGALAGTALYGLPAVAAVDPQPCPGAGGANVSITDNASSDQLLFAGPEDRIVSAFPANQVTNCPNSADPADEEEWLEVNGGLDPAEVSFISRTDTPTGPLSGSFTGPAGWVYAVVKPDNAWVAYLNTGDPLLLITDTFDKGISHITFFTPIPGAVGLMLTGLAGLAGWRRWRREGEGETVAA